MDRGGLGQVGGAGRQDREGQYGEQVFQIREFRVGPSPDPAAGGIVLSHRMGEERVVYRN
ncbi:TPA: hypothetical protein DCE37_00275 [Candidatus Latescibacteria bacterium]|nr:hypothetical protein [Candidatus Latescibacterota bacterium]